jgi:diaminohydroxyphosphoribosylaminopyrimidine deaminase/5-amino-6-(5-phosphoribosylamino)uracil reductase
MTDADFMARALFHAARGRGRTSPNPVVGAVVVSSDGVVVGQGYHQRAGDAHAEVRALDAAGLRARGGTLYCTLEPCSHVGRTGPCVNRIVDAGIARVVSAIEDPNPLVRGQGFAFLKDRGIEVNVGIGAQDARCQNQSFLTLFSTGRPFVTLKAAVSLDGCIAREPGERTQLTSAVANRHAHRIRAEVDAIAVGVGTILVDDPLLTARGAYRERPLTRVIFDRSLRTPCDARLLSTRAAGPVMIVTTPGGADRVDRRRLLEQHGAQVVVADGSIRGALEMLGQQGVNALLLEGGATLQEAAVAEGVVDFVRLYVAPQSFGERGVKFLNGRQFNVTELADPHMERLGPDTLIEGYVHGSG